MTEHTVTTASIRKGKRDTQCDVIVSSCLSNDIILANAILNCIQVILGFTPQELCFDIMKRLNQGWIQSH